MIQIDIPMPERCFTCQFRFVSYLDGNIKCALSGKIINFPIFGRHPDCPLIEVGDTDDPD